MLMVVSPNFFYSISNYLCVWWHGEYSGRCRWIISTGWWNGGIGSGGLRFVCTGGTASGCIGGVKVVVLGQSALFGKTHFS